MELNQVASENFVEHREIHDGDEEWSEPESLAGDCFNEGFVYLVEPVAFVESILGLVEHDGDALPILLQQSLHILSVANNDVIHAESGI